MRKRETVPLSVSFHDTLNVGSVTMPKIPFDASKVKWEPPDWRMRKTILEKAAEELREGKMDDETKKSLDELLGAVKKSRISPKAERYARAYGAPPYHREETFAEKEDRLRREHLERVAAEKARLERERLWREEELERERLTKIEREKREAAERDRLERERWRGRFEQLVSPPRIYHRDALKVEIAALSVNSAKACVVLRCVLCEELIQQFKTELPESKRSWNGIDQVWEFHPSVMPQVKSILKQYVKDIQVVGVPKAIPSTKFDQLLAKLNKEDKAAMYRLLAAKYHPDRGGSHEVMTLINQVFKEK